MMEYCVLPTRTELRKAVVDFLTETECEQSTQSINNYIIKRFNISRENVEARVDDGTTTIFAYRMCWVRTDLKKERVITSDKKGFWRIDK